MPFTGLGPVSRKSRNFSGVFRVTQFSLYLQNEGVSRHETLQLFSFLLLLQHIKRPALQNKQVVVLRLAFRARKVVGTFEKRAPGACFSKVPKLFGRISGDIILFVSSKQRRLEARNFAVIFVFIPFTTYEKTSFTE